MLMMKIGDKVTGVRFGRDVHSGEVVAATPRHFAVRWDDGVRHTCQQGYDYGSALQPAEKRDE